MNKLFIITGGSGSGKTTLLRQLTDNEIKSFTTRPAREGEVDGVDYKFISLEQFNEYKRQGKLIEYVNYNDHFYGVDQDEFNLRLQKGNAFVILTYEGMLQMKEYYNDSVTVFLYVPVTQAMERMKKRGDNEENIAKRVKTYLDELSNSKDYDYVIRNNENKFDYTLKMMECIIGSETILNKFMKSSCN